MSCSIAPTPRSWISSAEKPKQRPISSEMMPTFMACIEALSPAPSASTRMQISRASTILSTSARVSDSAWARASAGRAATSSSVCRQAREASPYCRSQSFCASRWASRRSCRAMRGAFLGRERRRLEPAGLGRRLRRRVRRARPPRRPRRRRRPTRRRHRSRRPWPDAAPPRSARRRRAARGRCPAGSSAPAPGRASGSSPPAPAVVMRKLLSGNGCDIQPTSRWTNIPTRSAWTSISGVMVLVAAFMGWRPAGDGRRG